MHQRTHNRRTQNTMFNKKKYMYRPILLVYAVLYFIACTIIYAHKGTYPCMEYYHVTLKIEFIVRDTNRNNDYFVGNRVVSQIRVTTAQMNKVKTILCLISTAFKQTRIRSTW